MTTTQAPRATVEPHAGTRNGRGHGSTAPAGGVTAPAAS
jgi:hypothetical protein